MFLSPIFTDAEGRWALSGVWPVGAPSDFSLYWQAWILDPHGVSGLAASNGLEMRVP